MGRLQLLVGVLQRVYRMLNEEERASWGAEFAPYVKGTSGQYTYHQLKGKAVNSQTILRHNPTSALEPV